MIESLPRRLACAALALTLAACGASNGTPDDASENTDRSDIGARLQEMERRGELPVLDRGPSLAGVDADGDGLRDDLGRYIESLNETPERAAALRQLARAISATLIADVNDDASLRAAGRGQMAAVACYVAKFPASESSDKLHRIRSLVVNTRDRFLAYDRYNAARSGSVSSLPRGDACE